jgi:type II secretory ATPase GspE/PulE/Tfp pilus assembly ATPase PilB-like protein
VFERLLLLCPDPSAVASAVELVLNQRLMRRLCPACAGTGCDACLRTGYQGRVPVAEWVRLTEPQREALRRRELATLIPALPLPAAARRLVDQRITNDPEYQRLFGL